MNLQRVVLLSIKALFIASIVLVFGGVLTGNTDIKLIGADALFLLLLTALVVITVASLLLSFGIISFLALSKEEKKEIIDKYRENKANHEENGGP